jgi:hypothetical protein
MPGRQMCTEISQISQRPMAFNGDIMGWLVDSIFLVGGFEHGFYDFPYIGNNNPN